LFFLFFIFKSSLNILETNPSLDMCLANIVYQLMLPYLCSSLIVFFKKTRSFNFDELQFAKFFFKGLESTADLENHKFELLGSTCMQMFLLL